jgi:nucleotide-binding universal stress UspA family protein
MSKNSFKKILYATDLSESGRQAFPAAASIAQCANAQLTVFHVVGSDDLETLLSYVNEDLWDQLTHQSLDDARQTLLQRKRENATIVDDISRYYEERLVDEQGQAQIAYEVKVVLGKRLESILDEAHSGQYDLLVISRHGDRASVSDAVIGDTTRRVVRRCQIPVMVVPIF